MKRFTATSPWILLKIFLLGGLNAFALWAIPILILNKTWVFAIYVGVSTLIIDYVFLSKKRIAAKYIVPGVLLLIAFQIYPALFTGYVAFTNYSTGHILNKDLAIEVLLSNSYESAPDAQPLTVQIARDVTNDELTLLVQKTPGEVTAAKKSGSSVIASSEASFDESGNLTSVQGFKFLSENEGYLIIDELTKLLAPIGDREFVRLLDLTSAEIVTPALRYDKSQDLMINNNSGIQYRPNEFGSFVSEDGSEELEPGWQTRVGWYNFERVLEDPRYRAPMVQVLTWTFIYAFLVVITTFFSGLLLALTFNHPKLKARKVYRSLIIVPYAMPSVLAILTWAGMFNEENGVINRMIGTQLPWLSDPTLAKVAVLLVQLWAGTPYMFLISTGAIQALPSEVLEAAQVDGASNNKIFWRIKLPLVLYSLTPLLIASYAYNFSNFGAIYLLTGGGPQIIESGGIAGHTDILISYTYKLAFTAGKGNDYGLASAVSFLNFFIIAILSTYAFRKSKTVESMT
jgi:arabinogalactan oligomer / maltooligosaccharide transport system permease protein